VVVISVKEHNKFGFRIPAFSDFLYENFDRKDWLICNEIYNVYIYFRNYPDAFLFLMRWSEEKRPQN